MSHQNVIFVGPRSYQVADGTAIEALRLVSWDEAGVTVRHSAVDDDILGSSGNTMPADAALRPRGPSSTIAVTPLGGGEGGRRFIAGGNIAVGDRLDGGANGSAVLITGGLGIGYQAVMAAVDGDVFEAVPYQRTAVA